MMLGIFTKQPSETIDYDVDFTDWMSVNDAIQSAIVSIVSSLSPDAMPLLNQSTNINTPRVKMWITAGTNGATYLVKVKVATTNGRIKEVEFKIKCKGY